MYGIKLYSYVPKPEPVTSDFIVAAHYYGAWKKGAAGLHKGFQEIYEYPERTPLIGYYDEENPELADWEFKWAIEHGINCFIYCWYRYRENVGHPVTTKNLRCAHALHEARFASRYGEQMQFAIMFETQNRWGATNARDLKENLMPFWLEQYFKRPNYLKIDNKPVLFVFDYQQQLRNAFSSTQELADAFEICREMARNNGFDGMLFALDHQSDDMTPMEEYKACGYDFTFTYCWPLSLRPSQNEIIKEQMQHMMVRKEYDANYFVPTASCAWDPWPRLKSMSYLYKEENQPRWQLQPNNFRKLLKDIRTLSESLPEGSYGRRIIMIDNWNEWDEGHYIAPSYEFGFRYLEAIRQELTRCDNLPDYRLPAQLGTNSVNHSWEEPDLSGYCKKMLDSPPPAL